MNRVTTSLEHAYKGASQWLKRKTPEQDIITIDDCAYTPIAVGTNDLAGIMCVKDDTAYIAFRGTWWLSDWVANLRFLSCSAEELGLQGRVHQGYKSLVLQIMSSLNKQIHEMWAQAGHITKRLLLCGHSRGGSVAALCAGMLSRVLDISETQLGVITLNAPSFGCKTLVRDIEERIQILRLEHLNDIVPRILKPLYDHAGERVLLAHRKAKGFLRNAIQDTLPVVIWTGLSLASTYFPEWEGFFDSLALLTYAGADLILQIGDIVENHRNPLPGDEALTSAVLQHYRIRCDFLDWRERIPI